MEIKRQKLTWKYSYIQLNITVHNSKTDNYGSAKRLKSEN